jgi:hypothetical protein
MRAEKQGAPHCTSKSKSHPTTVAFSHAGKPYQQPVRYRLGTSQFGDEPI